LGLSGRLKTATVAGLLATAAVLGQGGVSTASTAIPPSNLHITFSYYGCYIELAFDAAVISPEENQGSTDIAYYLVVDGQRDTIQSGWYNRTTSAYGDCMVYPQPGTHTIQVAAARTLQIPSGYEDDLLSNPVTWTYPS
jgi:hypothetical protein